MTSVIAVKKMANPSKSWLGFIRPLIREDSDRRPRKVETGEFPKNDEIFVFAEYERIDEFPEDELFCIQYKPDDQAAGHHDDRGAAFLCHGAHVEGLRRDEYFHVVDGELSPSERSISLPFRPSRLLMLRSISSGTLFGPFDYDDEGMDEEVIKLRLKACTVLPGFSGHDQHSVYKFESFDFETLNLGTQTILLANLSDLEGSDHEEVDFISDEALLKLGNELLPERERAQKSDLKAYRNALVALDGALPKFDTGRRQRLVALVERLDFWTARSSTLISEFLNREEGKVQLGKYLENNQEKVLAAAQKHFSGELETTKRALTDEVSALQQESTRLEQENLKTQTQVTNERQEQITQDLQVRQKEVEGKAQELETLTERLGIASEVDKLRVELEVCKRELSRERAELSTMERQVERLEETRQSTVRQLADSQNTLREKMQDLKPLIDVLNGVLPNRASTSISTSATPKRREDQPATAAELVSGVCQTLNAQGRPYRFDEVANFLVSIHQSFLTVFAGLPGVGKTSLATYLTEALGMRERLLYIAVARGMTSQRDILGFYNPLSQRYQPAPTGLYEMLRQQKDEMRMFPSWVLLDEANLSPIEHYFSSFLPMCDPDNKSREIKTGESSGVLVVPEAVRFLATINYDGTTEPLSGRLIDRVPIIKIEVPDGADSPSTTLPIVPAGLFSQADLDFLLSPTGPVEFTDDEEGVFMKVINTLRASHDSNHGLPIVVSPRKKNSIRRFCSAARTLMQQQDGLALRALDYAVAQHILPLLNGNGEQFLNRLQALQVAVQPLDLSRTQLKRIIEVGNNEHKFYRFFC